MPMLLLQKPVIQLLPTAVVFPCSELVFILNSACQSEKQKYAQDPVFFLLFSLCHYNLDFKIVLWIKSAKTRYHVEKDTWWESAQLKIAIKTAICKLILFH